MEKHTLSNRSFSFVKCFLSFLLIAFLTMSPFYASSDSEGDNTSVTDQIRDEMVRAGHADTTIIDEELAEHKNELSAVTSIEDSCIICHREQAGKP